MTLENRPNNFQYLQNYTPESVPLEGLRLFVAYLEEQHLKVPEYLAPETHTIQITRIPEGDKPFEIRIKWVGVIIDGARELIENADSSDGELEKGAWYAVPITSALPALLKQSVPATSWFAARSPLPEWLFFKKTGASIIEKQEPTRPK